MSVVAPMGKFIATHNATAFMEHQIFALSGKNFKRTGIENTCEERIQE